MVNFNQHRFFGEIKSKKRVSAILNGRHNMHLELFKKSDRIRSWKHHSTKISSVEANLNFNIRSFLKRKLSEKKSVSVLDLGCCSGVAAAEIKKEFGSKVRVVGATLDVPTNGDHTHKLNKVYEGDFLYERIPETFDLVYSHFGPMMHSPLSEKNIQKVIRLLRPSGIAVFNFIPEFITPKLVQKVMQQNGIKPSQYKIDGSIIKIKKPKRKLPGDKK